MDIIQHLEELSMLKFTESERKKFDSEFDTILNFVSEITKIDLDSLDGELKGKTLTEFRDDKVEKSIPREDALLNAPEKRDGAFVTPMVIE